jgi:hypothetical protein
MCGQCGAGFGDGVECGNCHCRSAHAIALAELDRIRADLAREKTRSLGLAAAFRRLVAIYEDQQEPTTRPDWVETAIHDPAAALAAHEKAIRSAARGEVLREAAPENVAAIIADLNDRRGLKWEWQKIDSDTRAEIVATWIAIAARPERAGRIMVEPVGVRDLRDGPGSRLSREPMNHSKVAVDQLVQVELPEGPGLPRAGRGVVAGRVAALDGVEQGCALGGVRQQLDLDRQLHLAPLDESERNERGPDAVAADLANWLASQKTRDGSLIHLGRRRHLDSLQPAELWHHGRILTQERIRRQVPARLLPGLKSGVSAMMAS